MIDAARVANLLAYDHETGVFTWKQTRRGTARAGSIAGATQHNGYRVIKIDDRAYPAHRLAWLISYGSMPSEQLDHINGKRSDNRLSNLRLATSSQNQQNLRTGRGLSSGFLGVTWHKQTGRWQAGIALTGRFFYLGLFDSPAEAHQAYLRAKRDLHPYQTICEGNPA